MKFTRATIPNFLGFLLRLAKAIVSRQPLKVSDDTYAERLSTCVVCPHYLQDTGQCGICTCFVLNKARMATETCPDHRWV